MLHPKVTAAFAIATLMTLAVVTAGCTTPTSPSPSPTPTPVVQTVTTAGNNTTLTSTAGFQITFPSKYRYDQNGSTPLKFYLYLDPNNTVTALNVNTDTLLPNTTLDVLTDYYTEQFLYFKNFTTVQNVTSSTLGGKPAKTLTYRAIIPVQYSGSLVRNQMLQVQEIWTSNNNSSYLITYKAPPSDFSKFLPEAQKVINSFQLT